MAGDERAFDEFVRARLPHLLRFGRALTCDDAAAGALVEESLATVLARWDASSQLTAEDDVRRAMVARFLSRQRLPARTETHGAKRDSTAWEALSALPPRQRTLLALCCQEQLTEGQAAELVGCSSGTARTLTEQALARVDEERMLRAVDEPVEVEEDELLLAVRRDARRRRRRRTLLVTTVAAAVMGALAAVGIVAARTGSDPSLGLEHKVFALAAVEDQVWAITQSADCAGCSTLWAGDGTADGWTERHTFDHSALVAELRLAPNGRDGFAWFGRDFLQATHDGGRTWVVPGVDLRDSNVDVQLAGGFVWVLLHDADAVQLWRSGIGTDAWELLRELPTAATRYALVGLGSEMFVVTYPFDGRAVLMPALDGRAHPIPCDAQPLAPRASAGALWVTCPDEGLGVAVRRSTDARTWHDVNVSMSTAEGSVPISDQATFVVTSTGGRRVTDDALTDVPLDLSVAESVDDGVFVTPETGFLLTDEGRVLRSDDGARTWQEVG